MFEVIEIRKVQNGFVISVDGQEYVFDAQRKVIKFIKDFTDSKASNKRSQSDSEE
jgi:hypothetical protein